MKTFDIVVDGQTVHVLAQPSTVRKDAWECTVFEKPTDDVPGKRIGAIQLGLKWLRAEGVSSAICDAIYARLFQAPEGEPMPDKDGIGEMNGIRFGVHPYRRLITAHGQTPLVLLWVDEYGRISFKWLDSDGGEWAVGRYADMMAWGDAIEQGKRTPIDEAEILHWRGHRWVSNGRSIIRLDHFDELRDEHGAPLEIEWDWLLGDPPAAAVLDQICGQEAIYQRRLELFREADEAADLDLARSVDGWIVGLPTYSRSIHAGCTLEQRTDTQAILVRRADNEVVAYLMPISAGMLEGVLAQLCLRQPEVQHEL